MSKKFSFYLNVIFLLLFISPFAFAAPAITTTSGSVVSGGSVVIGGSDFGTGPTVYKWDDFDGATHTDEATIGVGPGDLAWSVYQSGEPTYYTNPKISTSSPRYTGTQFVRSDIFLVDGDGDKSTSIFEAVDDATAVTTAYLTMYFRYQHVSGDTAQNNEKFWRLAGDDWGSGDTTPYARLVNNGPSESQVLDYSDDSHSYFPQPTDGAWVRVELIAEQGAAGSADGSIKLVSQRAEGGQFYTEIDLSDVVTRAVGDDGWHGVVFENYLSTEGYTGNVRYYHDYDDIYFASSQARVEIGNASTLAACTHREIQNPTAWSDTSISFDLQQGSFADNATAYLYVVDSDGAVNSSGYEVEIGCGSSSLTSGSGATNMTVSGGGLNFSQ